MKYEDHAKWLFEMTTEYLSGKCDDFKFQTMLEIIYKKVKNGDCK